MLNEYLEKAKEMLNSKFYCLFRDNNVLEISIDKNDLPFLFLVTDKEDLILMSFSVEFDNAALAAQLALELNDITSTAVAEDFYISKTGEVHWDAEALEAFVMDNFEYPLMDMEPISNLKN